MNQSAKSFTAEDARRIGEAIGIDWASSPFALAEFQDGLRVELEHGARDPQTNVTNDDELVTGRIAWAHLKEFPDYYERLGAMEATAEREWAAKRGTST
jgi:hypothetical protein